MLGLTGTEKRPLGLKWRSSVWFVTLVVGNGIATDLLVYSIIIPVVPFQLEKLGYSNVSGRTGWLLFAYSAGLSVSTPVVAHLSEIYRSRWWPMMFGLFALIGSNVMFMEAPNYWVMVIARIFQSVSSSAVWVVGLALLRDTTPEQKIGRQLGLALSSISIGFVIAPPIGGALYDHFGFRAPFIFGIICAAVEGFGRSLVIERRDALKWGHDPAAELTGNQSGNQEKSARSTDSATRNTNSAGQDRPSPTDPVSAPPISATGEPEDTSRSSPVTAQPNVHLGPLQVLLALSKSSRALASVLNIFIYGMVFVGLDPTLPLRLQSTWNFNPGRVGWAYVASGVPPIFSSPLTGWYIDRHGTAWMTPLSLLLSLPWWLVLIVRWHVALFIASFAVANFFMAGVVSALTAELAAVARTIPGIGFAHVFGAFNFAYGIGSGVGPLLSGQIYDHVRQGWVAVCSITASAVFVATIVSFCYIGERPLIKRVLHFKAQRREAIEPSAFA
ncbi:MFS general substrate transporter [Rickenella mellea]|uniref:MFS general substrate transporter n=1 Tax=Rickenella mellea TaxID=50990 RepID=A0A4Y7Q9C5_9AGAM|nr:MFS general substrate transporter [Rickenella mellea]